MMYSTTLNYQIDPPEKKQGLSTATKLSIQAKTLSTFDSKMASSNPAQGNTPVPQQGWGRV